MADPEFAKNPWSAEHWNLTRQGAYVRKYGVTMAEKKAADVGTTMTGKPKIMAGAYMPIPKGSNFTVIVQRRGSNNSGSFGSSGSGPPA